MIDVPRAWNAQTAAVVARESELALDSSDQSMPAVRARYEAERAWWNEGGPAMANTDEALVGGVRAVVQRPTTAPAGPAPAIVWIHGGGYIVGSPATHDRLTRTLAHLTGAVVVSVDYSLAPEARHPRQIEECVAVVEGLRRTGDGLGIVGADLTLAGDSAGATLALATWLWLRDELGADFGLRCLLLAYGAYGLQDSVSRRTLGGWWDGMTREAMREWAALHLGDADPAGPYVDLLARDLRGAPPCHVLAVRLDPLLDDSLALAELLPGEGHELHVADGVLHTFLQHSRMLDDADAALARMAAFHRRHTPAR